MIILEKIYADKAVIYDGEEKKIIDINLIKGAKTGDVLLFENGRYITDEAATKKRRSDIILLQNSLWE